MKYGLPEKTITQLSGLLKTFPEIEGAILYGSRAMGTHKPGSDIDLTLSGSTLSTDTLLRLQSAIDDLLLPYKVDLSIYEHIDNPSLVAHIKRVGVIFYQR